MRLLCIVIVPILLMAGCTTEYWVEDADEDVEGILTKKQVAFDQFRSDLIKSAADPRLTEEEKKELEREQDFSDVPAEVGLVQSLSIATRFNRDYQSALESLYQSALSLTEVRNDFSLLFSGALSAVLINTTDTARSSSEELNLGASQILPTGGTLALDINSRSIGDTGIVGGNTFLADWRVSLNQPLLRDSGYETSHGRLIQAERNVVYAIRDFELFREDFTIDVLTRYFSLVRQFREIENAEQDLESREFLMKQSEAKFEVGLATEIDKLRALGEYLRAQADLIDRQQAYQFDVDRFKIRLGLPTSHPLRIRPEEPVYEEVTIDLRRAVDAALHNRLDLITSRDQLEDAERDLRIRTNALLPDLDLTGDFGRRAAESESLTRLHFDQRNWSLGLELELPFNRISERNAMRNAIIGLNRSRRDLTLQEDNVILEVRNSLRELRRSITALEIREQEVQVADKTVRAASIRFEAGEMDNRNVSDAQNALLRARNAYIADLVSYEVARIQLFRDLGILFIDDHGMWVKP